MTYRARPSKSGYAFTQTSTLLHLLYKKKLISFGTIAAWSILAAGGDEHVGLQSTLVEYGVGQDAARKYVNELIKFGFLTQTTDQRFTKKVRGGKTRRAFDLVGVPDLSEWLTEEELDSKKRFVKGDLPTYTDEYDLRREASYRELYRKFSSNDDGTTPGFSGLDEVQKTAFVELVMSGEFEAGTDADWFVNRTGTLKE